MTLIVWLGVSAALYVAALIACLVHYLVAETSSGDEYFMVALIGWMFTFFWPAALVGFTGHLMLSAARKRVQKRIRPLSRVPSEDLRAVA